VLAPDQARSDAVRAFVDGCMHEHGATARRFANALVFSIPEAPGQLLDAARRHLAWDRLEHEATDLEAEQVAQLGEQKQRAKRDLSEAVWRTYRWLAFLGADGALREEDLGLVHSSAAESMQALIQARLRQQDELTEALAPSPIRSAAQILGTAKILTKTRSSPGHTRSTGTPVTKPGLECCAPFGSAQAGHPAGLGGVRRIFGPRPARLLGGR
jgi:hypothetical protein